MQFPLEHVKSEELHVRETGAEKKQKQKKIKQQSGQEGFVARQY